MDVFQLDTSFTVPKLNLLEDFPLIKVGEAVAAGTKFIISYSRNKAPRNRGLILH
jgi:hypothetical protein